MAKCNASYLEIPPSPSHTFQPHESQRKTRDTRYGHLGCARSAGLTAEVGVRRVTFVPRTLAGPRNSLWGLLRKPQMSCINTLESDDTESLVNAQTRTASTVISAPQSAYGEQTGFSRPAARHSPAAGHPLDPWATGESESRLPVQPLPHRTQKGGLEMNAPLL